MHNLKISVLLNQSSFRIISWETIHSFKWYYCGSRLFKFSSFLLFSFFPFFFLVVVMSYMVYASNNVKDHIVKSAHTSLLATCLPSSQAPDATDFHKKPAWMHFTHPSEWPCLISVPTFFKQAVTWHELCPACNFRVLAIVRIPLCWVEMVQYNLITSSFLF